MWPFKPKIKPKVIVVRIPGDKLEEFCRLHDDYQEHGGTLRRHLMWQCVRTFLPNDANGWNGKVLTENSPPTIEMTEPKEKNEKQS